MDANSMIKREPFYEILKTTTNEYGKTVYNEDIAFSQKPANGKKKMHFFMVHSFLSTLPVSKSTRKALYSEYNIRGSKIKYLLGKIGVFLITHSGSIFSKDKFYFSKASKALKNVMITPCNRSIRYFHFDLGYVDCVVKDMYRNTYMQNQLQFRLQEKYSFVPKITAYGDRWYREDIMYGNALARVTDNAEYLRAQKVAIGFIKQMADDTLNNANAKYYFSELEKNYFNIINIFSKELAKELSFLGEKLFGVSRALLDTTDITIPVVLSHGDLQAGNIWVGSDKRVTIYDWETVKLRSVWFDPATLFLKLHSSNFIDNFDNLIINDDRIFVNDTKKDYSEQDKKIIAMCVYIENILFYLDDIAQLPVEYSENICQDYVQSMKIDFQKRGIISEE